MRRINQGRPSRYLFVTTSLLFCQGGHSLAPAETPNHRPAETGPVNHTGREGTFFLSVSATPPSLISILYRKAGKKGGPACNLRDRKRERIAQLNRIRELNGSPNARNTSIANGPCSEVTNPQWTRPRTMGIVSLIHILGFG